MATPSPIPPNIQVITGPSVENSTNPAILGYVFNWGLYGALSVQVYNYYMSFPKDRRFAKAIVYSLYILETAQTILMTDDAFNQDAFGWGNIESLAGLGFSWLYVPIFDGIISFTVQMVFAHRITVLSGSKFIGCVISLIAFTQVVSAIVAGAQVKIIGNLQKLQREAFASTAIWLAGSAACDVVIAASMFYFLSRKEISVKSTQVMVDRIVRLTIQTGTLTATVATVDLILFLSFRHTNYHATAALVLGKLYTNNLLLMFNSRARIVGGRGVSDSPDLVELSTIAIKAPSSSSTHITTPTHITVNASHDNTASINVTQSSWTDGSRLNIARIQYSNSSEDGNHSAKLDEMTKRDQDWDSRV